VTRERGRVRRSRGLIDKSAETAPAAEPVWERYRDGALRDEQHIEFTAVDRVYQSLWRDGRQITDFVLIQQVKIRGKWRDVVKVDCCHQEVHAHHLCSNGTETKKILQKVAKPADLGIGLEKASTLIFDKWKDNLRRWDRGR
jgi:hypothetical protein